MSDLNAGQTISLSSSSFFIQSIIGEGGHSRVFRVNKVAGFFNGQMQLEREQYALKVCYCQNDDYEQLERLKEEIQIMVAFFSTQKSMSGFTASLIASELSTSHNPNTLQFLVLMEHFQSPVPIPGNETHFRHFFLNIISGLSLLHDQLGYIHMDIKMENVLFDPRNGKYVLCDFGSCLKPLCESSLLSRKSDTDFVSTL